MTRLMADGYLIGRTVLEPEPADDAALARVHDPAYIALIGRAAEQGGGWLDHDTMVTPGSDRAARLAAGGAILAVEQALGPARRAFAIVRPPGHHALGPTGMGFCLYNNVAVAVSTALARHRVERVLIIDWDVHHGNGTQAIFEEEPRVCCFSIHQWPHYPGSGLVDEVGRGPGRGTIINVPVPAGTGDAGFGRILRELLVPVARRFGPQLIVVSAGYDAHIADPLGGLRVTTAGYAAMTEVVVALADEVCDGRVAFVLEGGYNLDALADSVRATIDVADREQVGPALAVPTGGDDDRLVSRVIEQVRAIHNLT